MIIERILYDSECETFSLILRTQETDGDGDAPPPPALDILRHGRSAVIVSLEEAAELGRLLVALPILDRLQAEAERVAEATANALGDEAALEEADRFANELAEGRLPQKGATS